MDTAAPGRDTDPVNDGREFPWLALGLILLVSLVLRLIQLDHAPHFDEFYHLLGANSLLDDGDLCVADCVVPYDRAASFTYLVAAAVGLFGRSMLAARLVSVLAGLLLVTGVFWWTWRVAGKTAAWTAALLLALSPEAVYISQFVRFYGWHAVLVWAGAAALFLAVHPAPAWSGRRRLLLVGAAVLALLAAFELQITTIIVAVALGLWLLLDPIAAWAARELRLRPGRVVVLTAAALALVAVGALVGYRTGILAEMWTDYRSVNLFEVREASDIRYYHNMLLDSYPTLYSLLPVAFVISLWKRPAAAKFCVAMFGVALVVHSGGGFKAPRFLFYAMPFFFALWGLALATLLPPLVAGARTGMATWLGTDPRSRLASVAAAFLLAAVALGVLGTNSGYNTTLKMATLSDEEWPQTKPPYRGRPEWRPAVPELRDLAEAADVVVTTSSVKGFYYLGRSDAEVSVSRMFVGDRFVPDFSLDPRVGRPVLKSADAMARLIGCYATGLIIVEAHGWETEWGILPETSAVIAGDAVEIDLPPGSSLRAFRWGPDTREPHAACDPAPLSNPGTDLAWG